MKYQRENEFRKILHSPCGTQEWNKWSKQSRSKMQKQLNEAFICPSNCYWFVLYNFIHKYFINIFYQRLCWNWHLLLFQNMHYLWKNYHFLKTTSKYALLSTPIENRVATRMKTWSNFNNFCILLIKSSHEFHFEEWEKTENIKPVKWRIPSVK